MSRYGSSSSDYGLFQSHLVVVVSSNSNTITSKHGLSPPHDASPLQYRDSKLTHLLKTSLEGECRLIMIANINPNCITFEDSHNTLKVSL